MPMMSPFPMMPTGMPDAMTAASSFPPIMPMPGQNFNFSSFAGSQTQSNTQVGQLEAKIALLERKIKAKD